MRMRRCTVTVFVSVTTARGGNPLTSVGDDDLDLIAAARRTDPDGSTWRRILCRVVQDVPEETWLSRLPAADRWLLALRRAGHTLEEIAKTTGRSITAVLHRLKELGRELAERAGVGLVSKTGAA
jgi:hypothetical protein